MHSRRVLTSPWAHAVGSLYVFKMPPFLTLVLPQAKLKQQLAGARQRAAEAQKQAAAATRQLRRLDSTRAEGAPPPASGQTVRSGAKSSQKCAREQARRRAEVSRRQRAEAELAAARVEIAALKRSLSLERSRAEKLSVALGREREEHRWVHRPPGHRPTPGSSGAQSSRIYTARINHVKFGWTSTVPYSTRSPM